MARPGVTVVYSFTYRGNPEEWSQQYHFAGSAPSSDSDWNDLITSLMNYLVTAITDQVEIVRAYGYDDTDDDAAYIWIPGDHAFDGTGTWTTSGEALAPGDAAAWVRWKTSRTTSKGKPIYLRKYFHSVPLAGTDGDDQDSVLAGYRSRLEAVAADIQPAVDDWPGLAGPSSTETFLGISSSAYVTTRTLKRRGPRPH